MSVLTMMGACIARCRSSSSMRTTRTRASRSPSALRCGCWRRGTRQRRRHPRRTRQSPVSAAIDRRTRPWWLRHDRRAAQLFCIAAAAGAHGVCGYTRVAPGRQAGHRSTRAPRAGCPPPCALCGRAEHDGAQLRSAHCRDQHRRRRRLDWPSCTTRARGTRAVPAADGAWYTWRLPRRGRSLTSNAQAAWRDARLHGAPLPAVVPRQCCGRTTAELDAGLIVWCTPCQQRSYRDQTEQFARDAARRWAVCATRASTARQTRTRGTALTSATRASTATSCRPPRARAAPVHPAVNDLHPAAAARAGPPATPPATASERRGTERGAGGRGRQRAGSRGRAGGAARVRRGIVGQRWLRRRRLVLVRFRQRRQRLRPRPRARPRASPVHGLRLQGRARLAPDGAGTAPVRHVRGDDAHAPGAVGWDGRARGRLLRRRRGLRPPPVFSRAAALPPAARMARPPTARCVRSCPQARRSRAGTCALLGRCRSTAGAAPRPSAAARRTSPRRTSTCPRASAGGRHTRRRTTAGPGCRTCRASPLHA